MLAHYSTGENLSADVELIANGDFFDLLAPEATEPITEKITEKLCLSRLERIFDGHRELFEGLAAFNARDDRGIAFVVGNHDQALLWESLQRAVRTRIGGRVRFYPDSYGFDDVYVAHGHQFEFIHHYNPRDFAYEGPDGVEYLRLTWGSYFVLWVLSSGRRQRPYMDRVKPFRHYLRWALFNDFFFFWRMIARLVVFWGKNRFHPDPQRRREFAFAPTRVAAAMSHRPLPKLAESILVNTRFSVVVFGHSHHADYLNFGNVGEYFNTGTWTEVIHLDLPMLGPRRSLTYVLIETDESGRRARLMEWRGRQRLFKELA
jgi:UDP-2,3-diacylglucosamine pyrophosphatase LpxH